MRCRAINREDRFTDRRPAETRTFKVNLEPQGEPVRRGALNQKTRTALRPLADDKRHCVALGQLPFSHRNHRTRRAGWVQAAVNALPVFHTGCQPHGGIARLDSCVTREEWAG